MSVDGRDQEGVDGPRPGILKRATTATFIKVAAIHNIIFQFVRSWKMRRAGGQATARQGDRLALPENKESRQKSLSRSRSPTPQPERKIRSITYKKLMTLLHGGKEVLVAFYDNENSSILQKVLTKLEGLAIMVANPNVVIAKCKVGAHGGDIPFKLHRSPTVKLYSPGHNIPMEYFDDLESLVGYTRFLKEEGGVEWF